MPRKKPLHPEVEIEIPPVGNTFTLVSRTRAALKRSGVSNDECDKFFDEASSGGYDHAVATIRVWVTVS
jgi:hypothetical protein